MIVLACVCLFTSNIFAQNQTAPENQEQKSDQSKNNKETAKEKNQEGIVTLKADFLANGEVGNIVIVSIKDLDGNDIIDDKFMRKEAVEATKKIKFEPAKRNGKPIAVRKTLTFKFTIY